MKLTLYILGTLVVAAMSSMIFVAIVLASPFPDGLIHLSFILPWIVIYLAYRRWKS